MVIKQKLLYPVSAYKSMDFGLVGKDMFLCSVNQNFADFVFFESIFSDFKIRVFPFGIGLWEETDKIQEAGMTAFFVYNLKKTMPTIFKRHPRNSVIKQDLIWKC